MVFATAAIRHGDLRLAWVADPDGNPIQLAQERRPDSNP
jgi:hypothetical protein